MWKDNEQTPLNPRTNILVARKKSALFGFVCVPLNWLDPILHNLHKREIFGPNCDITNFLAAS